MDFLTADYVRLQSYDAQTALDASIKHWQQICTASRGDLLCFGPSLLKCNYCSLCQRYLRVNKSSMCAGCPLKLAFGKCDSSTNPWYAASTAFYKMRDGDLTLEEFREKARVVRDGLKDLIVGN